MSKFTTISTKLAMGGLALIAVAGGITAFATTNSTPVQDAINNKDLSAYRTALIQGATERGNATTQEQLNTMADKMATRKADMLKLDEAVKNNDFEVYKAAVKAHETTHLNTNKNHNIKTDEQIKVRFDADRKAYEADNTVLPSTMKMGEGKNHGRRK
jgi:hypothetical protein